MIGDGAKKQMFKSASSSELQSCNSWFEKVAVWSTNCRQEKLQIFSFSHRKCSFSILLLVQIREGNFQLGYDAIAAISLFSTMQKKNNVADQYDAASFRVIDVKIVGDSRTVTPIVSSPC